MIPQCDTGVPSSAGSGNAAPSNATPTTTAAIMPSRLDSHFHAAAAAFGAPSEPLSGRRLIRLLRSTPLPVGPRRVMIIASTAVTVRITALTGHGRSEASAW
ncbi:hypothetical protein GCM10023321_50470 [Pseudonocardia eucalypti]|uniref:Uncharacterized protein n=1 Tax=Pseudonocardia eucalypti TaxID=648755 RepID=A0ABP9QKN6_9PSEU